MGFVVSTKGGDFINPSALFSNQLSTRWINGFVNPIKIWKSDGYHFSNFQVSTHFYEQLSIFCKKGQYLWLLIFSSFWTLKTIFFQKLKKMSFWSKKHSLMIYETDCRVLHNRINFLRSLMKRRQCKLVSVIL